MLKKFEDKYFEIISTALDDVTSPLTELLTNAAENITWVVSG